MQPLRNGQCRREEHINEIFEPLGMDVAAIERKSERMEVQANGAQRIANVWLMEGIKNQRQNRNKTSICHRLVLCFFFSLFRAVFFTLVYRKCLPFAFCMCPIFTCVWHTTLFTHAPMFQHHNFQCPRTGRQRTPNEWCDELNWFSRNFTIRSLYYYYYYIIKIFFPCSCCVKGRLDELWMAKPLNRCNYI